jgi:hypothetical protein
LAGVTLAVGEPAATAARWSHVLGVSLSGDGTVGDEAVLALDDAEVRFVKVLDDGAEGLVEIVPAGVPGLEHGSEELEVGGVRLRST